MTDLAILVLLTVLAAFGGGLLGARVSIRRAGPRPAAERPTDPPPVTRAAQVSAAEPVRDDAADRRHRELIVQLAACVTDLQRLLAQQTARSDEDRRPQSAVAAHTRSPARAEPPSFMANLPAGFTGIARPTASAAAPTGAPPAGDTRTVVIVRSHGVLAGDEGAQRNEYRYAVTTRSIDFSAVLDRRAVRDALAALAAAPDDPALALRALDAVGAKDLFGPTEHTLSFRIPRSASVREDALLAGTPGVVYIDRCTGIGIGDHRRQHNRFDIEILDAGVDASGLLQQNRDVAQALIDVVVHQRSTEPLAAAIRTGLNRLPADPQLADGLGVQLQPRPGDAVVVEYAMGVTYGRGTTQENIPTTHVDEVSFMPLPDTIVPVTPNPGPRRHGLGL